jgi:hypothetical protein
MKKIVFVLSLSILAAATWYFISRSVNQPGENYAEAYMEEEEEEGPRHSRLRVQYDIDMMKDPATGKIPYGIREQELALARSIPEKGLTRISSRVLLPSIPIFLLAPITREAAPAGWPMMYGSMVPATRLSSQVA